MNTNNSMITTFHSKIFLQYVKWDPKEGVNVNNDVAQQAKVPGIHCYVVGLIPAVTPRYCTYKRKQKMLFGALKKDIGKGQGYGGQQDTLIWRGRFYIY